MSGLRQNFKSMGRMLQGILDPRSKELFRLMMDNLDAVERRVCLLETPEDDVWEQLPLAANWVNFGGSATKAEYSNDRHGFVHIQGVIKNGTITNGTVIAMLPEGYRPYLDTAYPIADNGNKGTAMVVIRTSGDIEVDGLTVNTEISLLGSFYAAR